MKFMVEIALPLGAKNKALEAFEERGPNRSPGVALRGAWVAAKEDRVYALVESASEPLVAEAASRWGAEGSIKITPVVDIEHF